MKKCKVFEIYKSDFLNMCSSSFEAQLPPFALKRFFNQNNLTQRMLVSWCPITGRVPKISEEFIFLVFSAETSSLGKCFVRGCRPDGFGRLSWVVAAAVRSRHRVTSRTRRGGDLTSPLSERLTAGTVGALLWSRLTGIPRWSCNRWAAVHSLRDNSWERRAALIVSAHFIGV